MSRLTSPWETTGIQLGARLLRAERGPVVRDTASWSAGSEGEGSEFTPMATTVNAAFYQFMSEIVNLDPKVTAKARTSRDWLVDQLQALHEIHEDFPMSYSEMDIFYGSFDRSTKIRELDDIDLISCMKAQGSTYAESGTTVHIYSPDGSRFADMRFDGTNELNSRKVVNRFVKRIEGIAQYASADVGRNGEAATLDLVSYPWKFDVVPGFFTTPEYDGRTYYIIPDGNGRWKKTDPRKDQEHVTRINQKHSGHVLSVIRLMKFWNCRPTMPTIPSYAFENLILSHYDYASDSTSWVDVEFARVVSWLGSAVFNAIWDPKVIQGDLNTLSWEQRTAVSARANADAKLAAAARQAEDDGDHKKSIGLWGDIFGPSFPIYG